MAAPPVEVGAVQVTVLWVLLFEVAETLVGTPDVVEGTTELLAPEATLVPLAFEAVTVKV